MRGPTLRLRTLGSPGVDGSEGTERGAATQRKPLALLALLARAGGRGITRDKILAYLWPETDSERGGHRLTQLVYSLRRDLHVEDLFLSAGGELRLNPESIALDVAEFAAALARGDLAAAVAVYGGPFLDGFFVGGSAEFDQWMEEERAELGRQFHEAVESLAEQAREAGRLSESAGWWGRLAQADSLNSRIAARYIDALAAAGDRAGALRFLRLHEEHMRQELGMPPDRVVLAVGERIRTANPKSDGPSIAVLPFINLTPERDNEYFSDGMTEELTNALTRVAGLQVVSRTSAFALKGKDLDVREIGARLGVATIVEGSVRKVGNRIRVTAKLVSTVDGYHLWSETYERTLEDVFALQEELSRAIAKALPLGGTAPPPAVPPSTNELEAYMLYLQARFFALKRTAEGLRIGIEYLEQAVELDPAYALAHAGLAECWLLSGFEEFGDTDPREAMPRAKAAAVRALELDPNLVEGHTWLGAIKFLYDHDDIAAEAELRRAMEIRPSHPFAHAWHAVILFGTGRHEEAILRARYAAELDPAVQMVLGIAYYYARRYEDALDTFASVLLLDQDSIRAHAWKGRCYAHTGQIELGLQFLLDAMGRIGRPPMLLEQLGRFLAQAGRRREAFTVLAELQELRAHRFVSRWWEVGIYLGLGLEDELQACCTKLVEERSPRMAFFFCDPTFDDVRTRPWFQDLVRRFSRKS